MTGWRYYYFVALAVKVPLTFWLLVAGRVALAWRTEPRKRPRDSILPLVIGLFLAITAIGSTPELWAPLPASPGTSGDRLGLAPGRARPSWMRSSCRWRAWLIGLGLAGTGSWPSRRFIPTN